MFPSLSRISESQYQPERTSWRAVAAEGTDGGSAACGTINSVLSIYRSFPPLTLMVMCEFPANDEALEDLHNETAVERRGFSLTFLLSSIAVTAQ